MRRALIAAPALAAVALVTYRAARPATMTRAQVHARVATLTTAVAFRDAGAASLVTKVSDPPAQLAPWFYFAAFPCEPASIDNPVASLHSVEAWAPTRRVALAAAGRFMTYIGQCAADDEDDE